jgi:alpha-L-fucosidase
MPVEVDVSIRRPNWFWSTTNENHLVSLDDLVEIYYRSIGRGAQLLLNLPPDRTGRIPEADALRAAQFGNEVRRRFGPAVGETGGSGPRIVLSFENATRVDHVILQEELSQGERVRAWKLDGFAFGHWRRLGEGSAIGHKLIHPVPPDGYTILRVTVTQSAGLPVVRRLAAYNAGVSAPRTWQDPAPLWADDAIGQWNGDSVSLDLTAKAATAGRYRLRLVPESGEAVEFRDVNLHIGETAAPTLANPVPGRRDALFLTIPLQGSRVTFKARVRGAPHGTILLQRW